MGGRRRYVEHIFHIHRRYVEPDITEIQRNPREEFRKVISGTVDHSGFSVGVDIIPMRVEKRPVSSVPVRLRSLLVPTSYAPLDSVREAYDERCQMYRARSMPEKFFRAM